MHSPPRRGGVSATSKNGSVPICRGRGGQFDTPSKASRTDHYEEAFRRRCKKYHRGIYVWFPSAEDLILLKLRAGRHTDFDDVVGIRSEERRVGRWCRV